MDGNYIKVNRSILEWEWYSDINTFRLFFHMLLRANWKDGKFRGTTVPRGSFISSIGKLAEETALTEREVRTAISHLKSTGEVTSKSTNKFTVFTVLNYDFYQSNDKQDDKQETGNRQTNDKLTTTIEEEKELEEGKKGNKDYQKVADLYNSICKSFPKVTKLSEARKKAIGARMNTGYTLDDFKRLFDLAESSEFLKGGNNRNWSADFEWLIKDANIAKVLEGKYTENRQEPKKEDSTKTPKKKNSFNDFPQRKYDFDELEQKLLQTGMNQQDGSEGGIGNGIQGQ